LLKNKISKKNTNYNNDVEYLSEGFMGCIYKVIPKTGLPFARKITFYNYNEFKINKKLFNASKSNPKLSNHLIIMKDYKIVNQIPEQLNKCNAIHFKEYKENEDTKKKYIETRPNFITLNKL
jgi:hypothetical protein